MVGGSRFRRRHRRISWHATHLISREILRDPRGCSIIAIIGRFTDLSWQLSALITNGKQIERAMEQATSKGWIELISHSLIPNILFRGTKRDFWENAALNYVSIDMERDGLRRIGLGGATTGGLKRMTSSFGDGERCGRFFRGLSRGLEQNIGRMWPANTNVRTFGVRHTIRLWLCYTIR